MIDRQKPKLQPMDNLRPSLFERYPLSCSGLLMTILAFTLLLIIGNFP